MDTIFEWIQLLLNTDKMVPLFSQMWLAFSDTTHHTPQTLPAVSHLSDTHRGPPSAIVQTMSRHQAY